MNTAFFTFCKVLIKHRIMFKVVSFGIVLCYIMCWAVLPPCRTNVLQLDNILYQGNVVSYIIYETQDSRKGLVNAWCMHCSTPCSVCVLKVRITPIIDNVLTNMFPLPWQAQQSGYCSIGSLVCHLLPGVERNLGSAAADTSTSQYISGNIIESVSFALCRTTWHICLLTDTDGDSPC